MLGSDLFSEGNFNIFNTFQAKDETSKCCSYNLSGEWIFNDTFTIEILQRRMIKRVVNDELARV
jgi:hypothetical protein